MLPNKVDIDSLRAQINGLSLCSRLSQHDYGDDFYNHLTSLMKFKLVKYNNIDEIKLNKKNYLGLEQYAFENTQLIEGEIPNDIDWDIIDDAKDILEKKIKDLLKKEGDNELLNPIVKFTISSYENWLIYNQLHPNSNSNPWIQTNTILWKGYIFLATDDKDLADNYQKKIYTKAEDDIKSNIGIITKSEKKNAFSGFLIDNRQKFQSLVFEYLKREARGKYNAKGLKSISSFLYDNQIYLSENNIRNKVTIPLKRAGLIGSTTTGFYFINNIDDLLYSYNHHKEKLKGIQRTLDMYKAKAKLLGYNLEPFEENEMTPPF